MIKYDNLKIAARNVKFSQIPIGRIFCSVQGLGAGNFFIKTAEDFSDDCSISNAVNLTTGFPAVFTSNDVPCVVYSEINIKWEP